VRSGGSKPGRPDETSPTSDAPGPISWRAGEQLSDAEVKKVKAYFARHAVDKKAPGFTRGTDGFPSPGRVAWDAWGGDPGERWVRGIDV
jgi:hypothetical protein